MNSRSNNTLPFEPDIPQFLHNCQAFTARFPELAALLGLHTDRSAVQRLKMLPAEYLLVQTRTGGAESDPALVIHGQYLHSKYNPQEEARRILASDFFKTGACKHGCVFAGCGLGYLPLLYTAEYPGAQAVIIEPDIHSFLCFLAAGSRTAFFRHEQLTLLIGLSPEEASSFLNSAGLNSTPVFQHTASRAVHKEWFDVFFTLRERTRTKNSINAKTLERFGTLWLKNTLKNADVLSGAAKINCFRNMFAGVPALVLAAGPSLSRHLALIKKTPRNYLIVAVDTALRACVHEGISPDFILSFDPQYWNYLHTAGLDTSRSILISEAAAFPAVFRQHYRAVFLSDSSVPFARFLEQESGTDCTLAAGGSVATTAWDFARYTGAQPIIMAGLDLAFPHKQTHFAGSTFEEGAHSMASRLQPAEQMSCRALYSAFPSAHADYYGGTVLTDRRMLMYAWWFESTLVKYPAVKTYNLMPEGMKIPGMPACTEQDFFSLTAGGMPQSGIQERLCCLIESAYSEAFRSGAPDRKRQLSEAVSAMTESAALLMQQAEEAENLCLRLREAAEPDGGTYSAGFHSKKQILDRLQSLDEAIRTGFAKNLIEVLCFTEEDTSRDPHDYARSVYRRIRETARQVCRVLAGV